jgi:hypothetical protein
MKNVNFDLMKFDLFFISKKILRFFLNIKTNGSKVSNTNTVNK